MKKEKIIFLVIGALLIILTGLSTQSSAGVNLNIGTGIPLPAIVLPAPPSLVVIPGRNVYYAPGIDVDLLFYNGYWYRPNDGHWYKCRSYKGPWTYVAPSRVPHALMNLPHDYRHISHGGRRIAYVLREGARLERDRRYWYNYMEEQTIGPMDHMGNMGSQEERPS